MTVLKVSNMNSPSNILKRPLFGSGYQFGGDFARKKVALESPEPFHRESIDFIHGNVIICMQMLGIRPR